MSDILEIMFMKQSELQEKLDSRVLYASLFIKFPEYNRLKIFAENKEIAKNFNETLHDHAEALTMESIELINWIAWKGWTEKLGNSWDREEGNKQFSDEHVHEMRKEAMDCLIFTVNIFLILGMTINDIKKLYEEKLATNIQRQKERY